MNEGGLYVMTRIVLTVPCMRDAIFKPSNHHHNTTTTHQQQTPTYNNLHPQTQSRNPPNNPILKQQSTRPQSTPHLISPQPWPTQKQTSQLSHVHPSTASNEHSQQPHPPNSPP